jgi:tetratricopeptide (TPR) repeat protein
MKKLFLAALVSILAISLNAQNVNDVWLLLQNNNVAGAQKKIEECMQISSYQTDATAWLYRGNVYLRVYDRDNERVKKNPEYVSRFPDAIFTAYESFYKALELNPKIEAVSGLIDPTNGQVTCGSEMYKIGMAAFEKNDYEKAKRYLSVAAKAFNPDPSMKIYSSYAYYFLYRIGIAENDAAAQKSALDDAIAINTDYDVIYRLAYNMYNSAKDTVKCGEILKAAKKNVPKDKRGTIYALELGYLVAVNDSVQLEKCLKNVMKYTKDTSVMADCANYLVDAKGFEKATELLDSALVHNPESFSINSMVAYNYYMQAAELGTLSSKAMSHSELSFNERLALSDKYKAEQDAVMEKAYEWALKSYQLNKNDHSNNTILKQVGMQLKKELPAELQ